MLKFVAVERGVDINANYVKLRKYELLSGDCTKLIKQIIKDAYQFDFSNENNHFQIFNSTINHLMNNIQFEFGYTTIETPLNKLKSEIDNYYQTLGELFALLLDVKEWNLYMYDVYLLED